MSSKCKKQNLAICKHKTRTYIHFVLKRNTIVIVIHMSFHNRGAFNIVAARLRYVDKSYWTESYVALAQSLKKLC